MPRLLSGPLRLEKNRLQSDHPWCFLFQINIQGAAGPYRLAAFDQDIFFQGNLYARYPLEVEILETPTHAALVQLRVTVGNVDQQLQSLLETYWAPQATPRWEVLVWEIDTTDPNQVPFSTAEVFSVQQVTTDLVSAQFDLTAEGLTLGTIVPRRRFTASSGFLNLPRRTR